MKNQQIQPLVSIIIPLRNAEKFLASCLKSISAQSYGRFEVIAIDDKSTDASFSILKHYKKLDKRFKAFQNVKAYGKAVSLNRAIKRAKGDFIAFMDPGDIAHKDRLKKQVTFLLSQTKTVAVGSQCSLINEKSKKIGQTNFPIDSASIYKKPIHGVSMLFESVMVNSMRIPSDILKFHTDALPYLYSDIVVKLMPYGEFVNLPTVLYSHREMATDSIRKNSLHIASVLKLWLRSEARNGYRPSIRSFIYPVLGLKINQ